MAKPISILEIKILLWYYEYPNTNPYPNIHNEDVQNALMRFRDLEIMSYHQNADIQIKVNQDALDCYVNSIMNVSLPTKIWIVPTEL